MKFSQLAIVLALFSFGIMPTQATTQYSQLEQINQISPGKYLSQIPYETPGQADRDTLLNAFMAYNKEDSLIKERVRFIILDPKMSTAEKQRLLSDLKPYRKAINSKYIETFKPFINIVEFQKLKKELDLMAEAEFKLNCQNTNSAICEN